MKANLKGLGNIKGLLLAHGEKIGIAIVGLCALMFIYSTLSHEPLPDEYQADRLKSQIDQVSREVSEAPWPEDPKDENVRIANLTIRAAENKVDPLQYVGSDKGWNPPVIRPTVLRTDPIFLAATEVKVSAGSGLLAFRDKSIERERALKEEEEKQEADKRQKAEADRAQPGQEGDRGGNRRGREDDAREAELLDPDRPNLRSVDSGVHPPGVVLDSSERIDSAYWAVVVAKVPIKEQLKLFRDALANARGYSSIEDVPQYVGYLVERAEVIPGQQPSWTRVGVFDGQTKNVQAGRALSQVVSPAVLEKVMTDWATTQPDVVDTRFLDLNSALTFPLPPLVWRDWGEESTHPGIPLLMNDEGLDKLEAEAAAEGAEGSERPGAAADSGEDFALGESPEGGRGGRSYQGRGGGSRRGGAGFSGRSRGGGRSMAGSRERGGRSRGGGRGRSEGQLVLAPDVTHWLLRFYDFSVQPGKKYQYRVQLALADPNSITSGGQGRLVSRDDVDQAVVSRQASNKGPKGVVLTSWSEPSNPVGVPLAGDVRLAGGRPPNENLYNDEPRASLLVQSFGFSPDGQAFQAAKQADDLRRGSVANLTDDVEILVDYGEHIDLLEDFAFRTGIAVLDIRGGEKLPARDMTVPSETLLMDPTGQLYVRRELKDAGDVELHNMMFSETDKRGGRGGRDEEPFNEGGRGGGRGGGGRGGR